ncbi:MAG: glycosyltransferase [Planctomycetota bacterium]|nr:glycosyltransferase [Planctomycetota bacterium]
MEIAVVLSTYNSPDVLRMSLLGFVAQQEADFQVLVADDGSDERTAKVLRESCFSSLNLKHVWHADEGFRLSAIRNAAIVATDADYLIFCDGDCIPRKDFVANHRRLARPSTFTAGGRIDVPSKVHRQFTEQQIVENQVFNPNFLEERDRGLRRFRNRLTAGQSMTAIMNRLTWRHCVFSGSNAAAWRKDLLDVNGFDEDFPGYGSEDRDMGVRLKNHGVKSRYLKYSLMQLHLDHPKSHFDPEISRRNREVFRRRKWDGTTRVAVGIEKLARAA